MRARGLSGFAKDFTDGGEYGGYEGDDDPFDFSEYLVSVVLPEGHFTSAVRFSGDKTNLLEAVVHPAGTTQAFHVEFTPAQTRLSRRVFLELLPYRRNNLMERRGAVEPVLVSAQAPGPVTPSSDSYSSFIESAISLNRPREWHRYSCGRGFLPVMELWLQTDT